MAPACGIGYDKVPSECSNVTENAPKPGASKFGATAVALLEAMRPTHWVKNGFVVAPILFSKRFTDPWSWAQCAPAFLAFCLLASAIYLVNDVCDRLQDQAHPVKRDRPIASGRLSPRAALTASLLLTACAVILVAVVARSNYDPSQPLAGLGLILWTGLYVVANLLYSFWLKNHIIVDVLTVALGFVLRAMAGAAAISVPISPWLVVCTLTLCLYIALAKRRSEIAEMPAGQAVMIRPAHRGYTKDGLEHMLTVSAAMAILTYCLYCLAPRTVRNVGSGHMIWTIPLVIYGMFRYYHLTCGSKGSDIFRILLGDRVMWFVLAAYALLSGLIIKFGSHQAVRSILDVNLS